MRLDLFPVRAILPDGAQVDGARLQVCDDGRLYVWDVTAGQPRQRWAALLADGSDLPSAYQSQHVRTEMSTDLGTLIIVRQGGCGCGSPLKGANLLATVGG